MTSEEKKQMVAIFNEGVEQVIMPVLQGIHTEMHEMKTTLDDHTFRLDRMERKLDATIDIADKHSVDIAQIKKRIGM